MDTFERFRRWTVRSPGLSALAAGVTGGVFGGVAALVVGDYSVEAVAAFAICFTAVVAGILYVVSRCIGQPDPAFGDLDPADSAIVRRALSYRLSRVEVPSDPRLRDLALRSARRLLTIHRRLRPWSIGLCVPLIAATLFLAVNGYVSSLWQLPIFAFPLAITLTEPPRLRRQVALLEGTA